MPILDIAESKNLPLFEIKQNCSNVSYIFQQSMQQETNELLEQILDNINSIVEFEGQSYYLLIKKQKSGNHCLFFLTDYSDNFWIIKITQGYLVQIKDQLKIKTSLKVFAEHFAYGVSKLSSLKQVQPFPVLLIKLKISEGLVINCKLKFDNCVNIEEKIDQFRSILRVFGRQMYEAKDSQTRKQITALQLAREKQQALARQKQQERIMNYKLLGKPQTKIIPEKHRDLINPFRKKRKGQGMKIGRKQSSSSQQDT